MKKLLLLLNTIKYLKPIQIRYQLWYRLRKQWRKLTKFSYLFSIKKQGNPVTFTQWIENPVSFKKNTFTFLNKSKTFSPDKINWNYPEFGKLWTYNLNYFDFLLQPEMNEERGKLVIENFIKHVDQKSTGIEPYPIALRGINWIKFLSKNRHCEDDEGGRSNLIRIDGCLYAQYQILLDNLEYHLLGNHLLEDGFSLLFGAYYFKDQNLYSKAKEILESELNEQILPDGGHFELSPMYHCIILYRLLDCYNLVSNNTFNNKELKPLFKRKSELMLSWINNITFKNGNIPLLNDAAFKIASTPKQLNDYALRLGININKAVKLKESGYRKISTNKFELVVDIGSIGPDYQPGHAHADTFSFELYINNRPVIVDTGTSTYELNDIRYYERSTSAHNTVVVENKNSSQVWGGFRVAKRARVRVLKDTPELISASHNGYRSVGQIHTRTFQSLGESICITDELDQQGTYFLHFNPSEKINIIDNTITGKDYSIMFMGAKNIECFTTEYSPEFNKRIPRQSVRVIFNKKMETYFK